MGSGGVGPPPVHVNAVTSHSPLGWSELEQLEVRWGQGVTGAQKAQLRAGAEQNTAQLSADTEEGSRLSRMVEGPFP